MKKPADTTTIQIDRAIHTRMKRAAKRKKEKLLPFANELIATALKQETPAKPKP